MCSRPRLSCAVNAIFEARQLLGADRASGVNLVRIKDVGADETAFTAQYDPGNPAADASGMVKIPNVNMIAEMSDMREANRSYEADLQVFKQSRDLVTMTIDLLKGA